MSTRGISLGGFLSLVLSLPVFGQAPDLEAPPLSYLNGTWAMGPGKPKYYFIVTHSWGEAISLGESSFKIDLGDDFVFVPGNGGWRVLGLRDKGNLVAEVKLESMDSGPGGHDQLTLTFHFLDRNKFWLESSFKGIDINTGPKKPWYRLSGPGDPPPPPSGPWPEM